MTHVINQGMAMYWGTSRWSSMEIMVGLKTITNNHKQTSDCFLALQIKHLSFHENTYKYSCCFRISFAVIEVFFF